MATYSSGRFRSSLVKKGFRQDKTGHRRQRHIFYRLHAWGRKTHITTFLSKGERQFPVHILKKRAQQMKLSLPEARDFLACPLDGPKYLALLTERGELRPPGAFPGS